tara:strand:+ start:1824 stop:2096 length:273 start_codon:yes stop_codon:yes gene_type:complete
MTTKRRSVLDVFNGICNEIPLDNNKIKKELKKSFASVSWDAPEKLNSNYYWNVLSNILNKYISEDDYNNIPWCKKVIDIFQDENYIYKSN